MSRSPYLLEVCVDSFESAQSAEAAGADRVELCANLNEGGTTPGIGLVRQCVQGLDIPVMVMVRPRGGDFCYSGSEFATLEMEIEAIKESGAQGVVFGLLLPNGDLDVSRTQQLVEQARPMEVTFHRAFDVCRDPVKVLQQLDATGVNRVLSSGQQPSAWQGRQLLAKMVQFPAQQIQVMPGAGVNPENIQELANITGAREFHFSAFQPEQSGMIYRNPAVSFQAVPREEFTSTKGNPEKVKAIRAALEGKI